MCCPIAKTTETAAFFKNIEILFWAAQIWIAACLVKPKFFFEGNVNILNWLLEKQGFDVKLPYSEKAFKVWKRDLTVLFILIWIVIGLIHVI